MKSRHLVDPGLLSLIESFPDVELTAERLPAVRAMTLPRPADPVATARVASRSARAPGIAGSPAVPLQLHVPDDLERPAPCVLHVHGGGFVAGSAAAMDAMLRPIALAAGCVIVSVDYRLAPETPFPGAIDDCYAALAWVFAQAKELGVDATRIGVMGESAGGGLAAGLALLVRDRREFPLAFQHLVYPMLDDRTCVGEPSNAYAGEFVWTRSKNRFGWSAWLGCEPGADGVSPYAAPARAESFAGLPRTFLSTGALDLFLDENLSYAQRLLRDGVPVELHVYPGAVHGFDFLGDTAVSRNANRDSLDALRRAMRGAAAPPPP